MRPLADYLFAVLVAVLSGGGWYLAHWGFNIALAYVRAVLRLAGGAS